MRLMGYGKGASTVVKPLAPRRAGQWRHILRLDPASASQSPRAARRNPAVS